MTKFTEKDYSELNESLTNTNQTFDDIKKIVWNLFNFDVREINEWTDKNDVRSDG